MKHSEAITAVESMLTNIRLTDKWGTPIIGIEAIAVIARHLPEKLEALENQFFSMEIPPKQYVDSMAKLIEELNQIRFMHRMDKCLSKAGGSVNA